MNKISKISIAASTAILGSAFFIGCGGGGSSSSSSISSSFGGVDGYIISLPEAATTASGKSTTSVGTKGKIVFSGTIDANDTVTIPASAIIDRNNDGKLDANDTAVGFVMKGPGDAEYITPLTTLALENNDTDLLKLAKTFDPVEEAKNITSEDNTTQAQAQAMIQLTEMVKTVVEASGSTNILSTIDTTAVTDDLNGTSGDDINVTAIAPAGYEDLVEAKSDTVTAVFDTLEAAEDEGINIDASSLMVQIFDGKQDVNDSVVENITGYYEDNATVFIASAAADIAKNSADTAMTAIDNISINNLKIGDDNIAFIDGSVTTDAIQRREVQYAEDTATYEIKFNVGNAISDLASLEDGDTKDVDLTVTLDDNNGNDISETVTLTIARDQNDTAAEYDATYSVIPSSSTYTEINGTEVTFDFASFISDNWWDDEYGVLDYILTFTPTEVNTSIVNSNENNISGQIDIGNTDYDKVNDDHTSLLLASDTSGNLSLDTTGTRSSAISWDSNDTSIMEDDGTLVGSILDRLEDQLVNLTATIVSGAETLTKEFRVTVNASTDENIVAYAKDNLIISDTDLINNIELDTNMTTDDGRWIANISWDSNDTSILTNTGEINATVVDRAVTLDANISRNSESDIKTFNLTVKADDTKIVDAAITDLNTTINTAYTLTDINSFISNLTLDTTGLYGSTISWESNDTSIVTNDGNITGRSYEAKDVTLTATVTSNEATDTKEFVAQISPYSNTELVTMAKSELKVGEYDNNETAIISSNLPLTTYNENYDVNITWSSTGDTDSTFTDVTNTTINRTDVQRDDVNISAYIFRDDVNMRKDFNASILASDNFILAQDVVLLDGIATAQASVAADATVNMPTTLTNGTTVVWSSSNESVITSEGVITPSAADQSVTLTAVISRGSEPDVTKEYSMTILADSDMQAVSIVKAAYDADYNSRSMDIDGSGDASIILLTTNTEGVTVTWTKDGYPVAGTDTIASLTTAQTISYVATFTSNAYAETSTAYTYTIAADSNREIGFSDAGITGAVTDLANGSTRDFSVTIVDGYDNVQAGETVTFSATSGTITTSVDTDSNGVATATFTATAEAAASVTATYGSSLTANFTVVADPYADLANLILYDAAYTTTLTKKFQFSGKAGDFSDVSSITVSSDVDVTDTTPITNATQMTVYIMKNSTTDTANYIAFKLDTASSFYGDKSVIIKFTSGGNEYGITMDITADDTDTKYVQATLIQ